MNTPWRGAPAELGAPRRAFLRSAERDPRSTLHPLTRAQNPINSRGYGILRSRIRGESSANCAPTLMGSRRLRGPAPIETLIERGDSRKATQDN